MELDELDRAAPDRVARRAPSQPTTPSGTAASEPPLAPAPTDLASLVFPSEYSHPPQTPSRALCWQGLRSTGPIVAADVLALAGSGIAAAAAVHLIWPHAAVLWPPMMVVVALLPMAYALCGLYSPVGSSPILELRHLIQVNSIGFIAAALGGMLAPPLPLWCMATWVAAVGLVPLLRSLVRRYCAQTEWWGRPTLVISPAQTADAVVLAMIHAPTSGFRPVAVTDPAGPCWSALTPAVNDAAQLEKIVRELSIRYAVVNVADRNPASVREIFARYSALIPHLIVLTDTPDLPCLWGATRSCGRLGGVEMSNARLLSSLWTLKRAIDVAVALIALVLFFPLMAAVALAIKLTSPGPIFFGHRRLGFQGKWFNAWKFRTMHPNGDAVLRDYLAAHPVARDEWERDQKLRSDPRVTRIGKFLRRSSLDELPQVWNVLKGEMSLVGPRPIVAKEVAKYGHVFGKYAAVKPGITGMWQVSGRNEVSYEERVKLDQYYVANWSPWLDLFILAKTIIVLIRRDGAY
jgi:Undecaprenyl-phosphate galactose phosphotransferase WbaP